MKVILVGLAQSVGGWLITAALLSWVMKTFWGAAYGATIGFSLLAGALIWVAIGLFIAAFGRLRERAAILRGTSAQTPQDGRRTVLVGTVRPTGAPLSAPLDGSACVMYRYDVRYDAGSGKRRSAGTIARGVGLTPCRVVTAGGDYKLLAVPDIVGLSPVNGSADQAQRFRTHVRRTTFVQAKEASAELLRQWADADGSYRSDVALVPLQDADDRFWTFHQQHIPAGEPVCVFGVYSQEKSGIVPAATAPVRVEIGHAEEIADRLRQQAVRWSVIGLCMLAVPIAIGLLNLA